ncbi:hypothetical protein WH47_02868, partial [Habropoda laboriosa]
NDMNTDVLQDNGPRYEKLAKPKKRIDKTSNFNAFNVKRGALSYQITDSLNKLAQPKWKTGANVSNESNISVSSSPASTVKRGHKLINRNMHSKYGLEGKKKEFLLDTYAHITATRYKGCSERLRELAKPKNYSPRTENYQDFDNYFQTIKKYNGKHLLPNKKIT